jgi:hypothetical protein
MWDDGMRNCEGLKSIYMEEFGSHECIVCIRPLNRVKKRGKLVWPVNETGMTTKKTCSMSNSS